MHFLLETSFHFLELVGMVLKLMLRFTRWKNDLAKRFERKKESAEPMKKSYLIAIIAALAAVAGALAAAAVYLRRREKELDEYEHLLFDEDEVETVEQEADAAADAEPAEEAEEPAAEDAAE